MTPLKNVVGLLAAPGLSLALAWSVPPLKVNVLVPLRPVTTGVSDVPPLRLYVPTEAAPNVGSAACWAMSTPM